MTKLENAVEKVMEYYGLECPYDFLQGTDTANWTEARKEYTELLKDNDSAVRGEIENLWIHIEKLTDQLKWDPDDTDARRSLDLAEKALKAMKDLLLFLYSRSK